MDQCTFRIIILIFLAPHSYDQCEMLDLCAFGVQKTLIKQSFQSDLLSAQSKQIIRILGNWYASATPPNIIGSFKIAGFEPYIENGVMYYRINRAEATKVRHFTLPNVKPDLAALTP